MLVSGHVSEEEHLVHLVYFVVVALLDACMQFALHVVGASFWVINTNTMGLCTVQNWCRGSLCWRSLLAPFPVAATCTLPELIFFLAEATIDGYFPICLYHCGKHYFPR